MPDIQTMFSRITPAYDRLNFFLSFGLDRLWRREVLKALIGYSTLNPQHSSNGTKPKVLDACTGTGDLAILLARQGYDVTGVDFCEPMLEKARMKAPKGVSLSFTEADVNHLPFPDRSFQVVTSAFSLRNLPNLKNAFLEAYRVLAPGGVAIFLDLTRPQSWLSGFHALYLRWVVPRLGRLLSGDAQAYDYLSQSIFRFQTACEIRNILESCSFSRVTVKPLTFGICTLWTARA